MKNKSGHNLKQNDLLFLQARVNGLVLKGAAVIYLSYEKIQYHRNDFDNGIKTACYPKLKWATGIN